MQFNVSQLLREPVGATREHDIDDKVEIEGEPRRLTGVVEFIRTDRGVLVRADLRGDVHAECSRCLTPLDRPARLTFEEEYTQTTDAATGAPIGAAPEPDAFIIDARHTLDLREAVRQYWVLAESMQPLCRPDCAGICPNCGRNRNDQPCDCEPADPRWAALEALQALKER